MRFRFDRVDKLQVYVSRSMLYLPSQQVHAILIQLWYKVKKTELDDSKSVKKNLRQSTIEYINSFSKELGGADYVFDGDDDEDD